MLITTCKELFLQALSNVLPICSIISMLIRIEINTQVSFFLLCYEIIYIKLIIKAMLFGPFLGHFVFTGISSIIH